MKRIAPLLLALMISLMATSAYALSTSGDIVYFPTAPSSVLQDAFASDDHISLFEEVQGYTLTTDINVDMTGPGTVSVVSTAPVVLK
ncbi:MAG: hypothetical protein ACE5GF_00885 [Thermodesulfobacteriota bacterium]